MKSIASSFIIFIISLFWISICDAQINWSVNAGGGVFFMEDLALGETSNFNTTGGPLIQIGTSISSLFGNDSMVGWEAGLNLVHKSYDWTSLIDSERRGTVKDWYLQLPVSLTLNLFEKVGFHFGARLNRRLSNLDTYVPTYRKWIPTTHLGMYAQISDRIRLDVTGYLDMLTTNKETEWGFHDKSRGIGGYLNIRYTIK